MAKVKSMHSSHMAVRFGSGVQNFNAGNVDELSSVPTAPFNVGDIVHHEERGEGVVIKPPQDDGKLYVRFDKQGDVHGYDELSLSTGKLRQHRSGEGVGIFRRGDRVSHPLKGDGTVESVVTTDSHVRVKYQTGKRQGEVSSYRCSDLKRLSGIPALHPHHPQHNITLCTRAPARVRVRAHTHTSPHM